MISITGSYLSPGPKWVHWAQGDWALLLTDEKEYFGAFINFGVMAFPTPRGRNQPIEIPTSPIDIQISANIQKCMYVCT